MSKFCSSLREFVSTDDVKKMVNSAKEVYSFRMDSYSMGVTFCRSKLQRKPS